MIASFATQFAAAQRLYAAGGWATIVDVQPPGLLDPVPVLLAPGWGGTPTTYRTSLRQLYASNRHGISIGYARKAGELEPHTSPSSWVEHFRTPVSGVGCHLAELPKIATILAVLRQKHIEKVDVIAHSEGCINSMIAAEILPDLFRNIVLVDPAGLLLFDTMPALLLRLLKSLAQDSRTAVRQSRERGPLLESGLEAVKYFAENPRESFLEAQAIATVSINEILGLLNQKGIGVSIIQGVDDLLFPIQRLLAALQQKPAIIAGFYAVRGGHTKLLSDPAYTRLALNALTT